MALNKRDYVVKLIAQVARVDLPTADMVVDRLQGEGLLVLGYGDKDVEQVIATFAGTFGTTKSSRYDRWAAHRLVEKHTAQAVCGVISLLGQKQAEAYAPVVNNIAELETKWMSVLNFLRKQNDKTPIDI